MCLFLSGNILIRNLECMRSCAKEWPLAYLALNVEDLNVPNNGRPTHAHLSLCSGYAGKLEQERQQCILSYLVWKVENVWKIWEFCDLLKFSELQ